MVELCTHGSAVVADMKKKKKQIKDGPISQKVFSLSNLYCVYFGFMQSSSYPILIQLTTLPISMSQLASSLSHDHGQVI